MPETSRTDQQIVDQTNQLARRLYALRGYTVREGYRFDEATHPHEVEAWQGACAAQLLLTHTDPNEALDNLL
jgi:alpha-D-ribose 1-methylphosphonate 5-phosphate C-P lyase